MRLMNMSKVKRVIVTVCAAAILVAAGLGLWRWVTYPRYPDLATAPVEEVVGFVGTADFNRMSAAHRKAYCLGAAERLRERSFPELIAMVMARRGDLRPVAENVKGSGAREEVEAAVLRVIMDKFYEEPAAKRSLYLWSLVKMQQAGTTGKDGIGLPSAKQLQRDMTRVVTRQPPQTVAKMGQFVQDLQKQRRTMGLPDPY